MTIRKHLWLISAGLRWVSLPAAAEVVHSGPGGFSVSHSVEVAAEPNAIWPTMSSHIDQWWDGSHSWSGDASNLTITPELEMEGRARDIVRQVQELRKAADYKVDDRIEIALIGADSELISKFGDYIKSETLATEIKDDITDADQFTDFEGITIKVKR